MGGAIDETAPLIGMFEHTFISPVKDLFFHWLFTTTRCRRLRAIGGSLQRAVEARRGLVVLQRVVEEGIR